MKQEGEIQCPLCRGEGCGKCKNTGRVTWSMAPAEFLEHFPRQVEVIKSALCEVFKIGGMWLTDRSSIGDFTGIRKDDNEKEQLEELSVILGFEVSTQDSIVTVAKKLKKVMDKADDGLWRDSYS